MMRVFYLPEEVFIVPLRMPSTHTENYRTYTNAKKAGRSNCKCQTPFSKEEDLEEIMVSSCPD